MIIHVQDEFEVTDAEITVALDFLNQHGDNELGRAILVLVCAASDRRRAVITVHDKQKA